MGDDGKNRFLLPQKCVHPVSILQMDLYLVKIVQGARIKISAERHLVRIALLIRTVLLAVMKQLTVWVSIFIILRTYEKQYGISDVQTAVMRRPAMLAAMSNLTVMLSVFVRPVTGFTCFVVLGEYTQIAKSN